MKNLPTITKIGQAALLRLFKPYEISNSMETKSRTVIFQKIELESLSGPLVTSESNVHYGEIQSREGERYMVWGISLGLRGLEANDGHSTLSSIFSMMQESNDFTIPSHFIIHDWSSNDVDGEREYYTIYRLSQKQEAEIATYVSMRQAEIEASRPTYCM